MHHWYKTNLRLQVITEGVKYNFFSNWLILEPLAQQSYRIHLIILKMGCVILKDLHVEFLPKDRDGRY